MRHHCPLDGMTEARTLTPPAAAEDAEEREVPARLEDTHGAAPGKTAGRVLTTPNGCTAKRMHRALRRRTRGARPEDLETSVHTETRTSLFVAALFAVGQTWKKPRCHVLQAGAEHMAWPQGPGWGSGPCSGCGEAQLPSLACGFECVVALGSAHTCLGL